MFLIFDDRLSDSPFVERVWRSHSDRAGTFLSVAASHFEMAVTRHRGKTFLTLRGPETKATTADCPAEGEWLGIRFKLGTFMPQLHTGQLRDRRDVTLPDATSRSFWLNGSAWEYPDFENAETFVTRLARKGVIARDPAVDAAVRGQAASAVPAIRPAPFSASDRPDPLRGSSNRTRPTRDEPPEGGRLHSRHRPRSRLFRSGASYPIAQIPDRTDTSGDHSRATAVVVFIQNNAPSMSL